MSASSLISRAALVHCALLGALHAAPITALYYTGSESSWISQGRTEIANADSGYTITASRNYDNGASFSIVKPDYSSWWYLDLAAPGDAPITVGAYTGATRSPFQVSTAPGLSFSGNGRGNNTLTGSFTVLEATYAQDGSIQTFAADFTQYDEGIADRWNTGAIRYNSSFDLPVRIFTTDTTAEFAAFTTKDAIIRGPGTVIFTGANTYQNTVIESGTLQIGNGGTSGNLGTGSINLTGNLAFNRSDAVPLASDIIGHGTLTQNGAGNLNLTGTINTDEITVRAGSLTLAAATSQLGVNVRAINIENGATLTVNHNESVGEGYIAINGTLNGSGTITAANYLLERATVVANLGTGTLETFSDNTISGTTAAGEIAIWDGSLTLTQGGRLIGQNISLFVCDCGTLTLGGDESVADAYIAGTLTGTGHTLTAENYGLNGAFVSANLGAGGLISIGSGTISGTTAASEIFVAGGNLTFTQEGRITGQNVQLGVSRGATLTLGGDESLHGGTALIAGNLNTSAPGATLTATRYILKNGTIRANLGTGILEVGTPTTPPPTTTTNSGSTDNNAIGSGTIIVSGSNNYTGSSTVDLGSGSATLTVNYGGITQLEPGSFIKVAGPLDRYGSGSTVSGTTTLVNGVPVAMMPAPPAAPVNPFPDPDYTEGDVTLYGTSAATDISVYSGHLILATPARLIGGDITLSIASGATLSLGGDESLGAGTATIDGAVTGTGTLTAAHYSLNGATISGHLGEGILTSTGASAISGTTAAAAVEVNSGTLTISGGTALADNAHVTLAPGAGLTVNTAETIGAITTDAASTLKLNDTLTVTQNSAIAGSALTGTGTLAVSVDAVATVSAHEGILAQSITGLGNLALTGTGTTTLTGSRLNNSLVSIGAGHTLDLGTDKTIAQTSAFIIEAGATLRGQGSIGALTVNNGGTFRPGNSPGIVNVNGDFTNNGTLVMEIAGNGGAGAVNGHDQINATGAVVVNGTLTLSLTNGFNPAGGGTQAFNLFYSATGNITGTALTGAALPTTTLGRVTVSNGVVTYTSYDSFAALPGVSLSPTAAAFADSLIAGGTGTGTAAGKLLAAYDAGGAAALASAVNTASPAPLAALSTLAIEQSRGTAETIRTRLDSLRRPAIGSTATASTAKAASSFLAAPGLVRDSGAWAAFAAVSGSEASTDSKLSSFDRRTFGGKVGLENRVSSDLNLGLALGYDKGLASLHNHGGRIEQEHLNATAYLGTKFDDATFVYLGAFAGLSDYESKRNAGFGDITGDTEGRDYGLTALLGHQFELGNNISITPYAGLTAAWAYVDGFTESGALATTIEDHREGSFRSKLGADIDWKVSATPTSSVRIGLTTAWEHELSGNSVPLPASIGGSSFNTSASGIARDILSVGPVCTLDWDGGNSIRASVQKQYGFGDENGARFDLAYSKRF